MTSRQDMGRLRDRAEEALAALGISTARQLQQALGVSQPTLSRVLSGMWDRVLKIGKARATRYALRRRVEEVGDEVPLHDVRPDGTARRFGTLHPIWPEGFWFDSAIDGVESALYEDLPWFLDDLRPRGFLGRLVPAQHPELELPPDVRVWSADQCLRYLVRHGADLPGAFVLGDVSLRAALSGTGAPMVAVADRANRYPEMAASILEAGIPGSSAAGEQPKFLARLDDGEAVVVKFSPRMATATGRRWGDILVCEHLLHEVIAELAPPAVRSDVVIADDRVFLEVARFDRVGASGRRCVASMMAIDSEFVGRLRSWADTAHALARQRLVRPEVVDRVRFLQTLGRLTSNTDMHAGNLSLFLDGLLLGDVCPPYDMCPMAYAPRQEELSSRLLEVAPPDSMELAAFGAAATAAATFWQRAAEDERVSEPFREVCAGNAAAFLPT